MVNGIGKIGYRQLFSIAVAAVLISGAVVPFVQIAQAAGVGTVSGLAFNDINGDGLQDEGEEGIENASICATNSTSFDECVLTASDGTFTIENVPAGDIVVYEEGLLGHILTTPTFYAVPLADGESFEEAFFGYQPVGTIIGVKFLDEDGDGLGSESEGFIEGVEICAVNTDLSFEDCDVTDADGSFAIVDFPAGNVEVFEVVPEGYEQTLPDFEAYSFTLAAGDFVGDIDFANHPIGGEETGSVSGFKFEDLDGDGVWDEDEFGLEDVQVCALNPLELYEECVLTGADGNYTLSGVPTGIVQVTETVPDGYEQTFPTDFEEVDGVSALNGDYNVTLAANDEVIDLDFGNHLIEGGGGGGGGGSEEWTLYATDAGGGSLYTIDVSTGEPTLVGFMDISAPSLAVNPSGFMYAGSGAGEGFLYEVDPFTGEIFVVGDSGLGLSAIGGMDFNSTGTLYASVNLAGNGGTGSDHLAYMNLSSGEAVIIGSFGECTDIVVPTEGDGSCTIEGMEAIAFAPDGTLYGATSNAELFTIDTSTGLATFLMPIVNSTEGSVHIASMQFAPDGTLYAGTARGVGDFGTLDTDTGLFTLIGNTFADFSLGALALCESCEPPVIEETGTISGTKFEDIDGDGLWDIDEFGLEGIEICAFNEEAGFSICVDTAGDGSYIIENIPVGTVIVNETVPEGYLQTYPTDFEEDLVLALDGEYSIVVADGFFFEEIDFGNHPIGGEETGSVSGFKFEDLDGDGVWDEDEFGLEDVQVCALNPLELYEECVLTGADGNYTLSGVPTGIVQVTETVPDGYEQTFPTDFEEVDGVSALNGDYNVTLAANDEVIDLDFGNHPTGEGITGSGVKFIDANGDGEWDETENGLEGVQINAEVITYEVTNSAQEGGPAFVFIDIRETGNLVPFGPFGFAESDLGFDFELFGVPSDEIVIFDDGTILLDGGIIVPYDDPTLHDIDPAIYELSDPVNGRYIVMVEYGDVEEDRSVIFEIVFEEEDDSIILQYLHVWDDEFNPVPPSTIMIEPTIIGPSTDITIMISDDESIVENEQSFKVTPSRELFDSDVTDEFGEYSVDLVPDQLMVISEQMPTGYIQTYPWIGPGMHSVVTDEDEFDLDFGNQPLEGTGNVTGVKFFDEDGDGIRDEGESGLEGVFICVFNFEEFERCTETDETGAYTLIGVVPGDIVIEESSPHGYVPTTPENGQLETSIEPGAVLTVNFGNFAYPTGNVTGFKFLDEDGDGVFDEGEDTLADVEICAENEEANYFDCTETDVNGFYTLENVPAIGQTLISEDVPFGYAPTTPEDGEIIVELADGQELTLLFGNEIFEFGSIFGHKFEDLNINGEWDDGEDPIAGVTIQAETVYQVLDNTDEDGPVFDFNDISGTGTEVLSDNDDESVTVPIGFDFVIRDETVNEIDISTNGRLHTIDSTISPFADDLVTLDSENAGAVYYQTIGEVGSQQFIVQWNNTQHYPFSDSGITFQAILYEGTNEIKFQYLNTTFGDAFYDSGAFASVGLTIFGDFFLNVLYSQNQPVITDGLAILFTPDSSVIGSDITDESGFYSIDNVPALTAVIVSETVPEGFEPVYPENGVTAVTLTNGDQRLDFGNVEALLEGEAMIFGYKFEDLDGDEEWDEDENPIEGLTICLELLDIDSLECTETDEEGYYEFLTIVDFASSFLLSEVIPDGYIPTISGDYAGIIEPGDRLRLDFGNMPTETATVFGTKFLDRNRDGIMDEGEPGLGGIEICVEHDTIEFFDCVETAEDGSYSLVVPIGDLVVFEDSFGYTHTTPSAVELTLELDDSVQVDFGNVLPGAIIGNGEVILGVDEEGQLNIGYRAVPGLDLPEIDPSGVGVVGLRDGSGAFASTEPGCLCEGWGVAGSIGESDFGGFANNAEGGAFNLEVESFVGLDGDETAESTVIVKDGEDNPALRVTHIFEPSEAAPNLYSVQVIVENVGENEVDNIVYRRAMDWDIFPTPFDEFVTIQGATTTPILLNSGNNGFISTDILSSNTPEDFVITVGSQTFEEAVDAWYLQDFVDSGVQDHGAAFDFDLGTLGAGDSLTLNIFYGNAPSEADALAALTSQGAELYSLGQSTIFGEVDVPDNLGVQGPTFMFAFAGLGGSTISPTLDINIIKFNDHNGNGIQNTFDERLSGWTFEVRDALGNLLGTVTTDETGSATFSIADTSATPFPYSITEVEQEGWILTTPETRTVTAFGSSIKTVKFGNQEAPDTFVSIFKFNDRNADGEWDESLEEGLQGFEFDIYDGENNLLGTVFSDFFGEAFFVIDSDTPGPYNVTEVGPDEGSIPTTPPSVIFEPDETVELMFGNLLVGTIEGIKYNDVNGNGIFDFGDEPLEGWEIVLTNGTVVQSTFTDEFGGYSFIGLEEGLYDVYEIQQEGWIQTQPAFGGNYTLLVGSGDAYSGVNFGNTETTETLISGTKYDDLNGDRDRDEGEPGIPDIDILLVGIDPTNGNEFVIDATETDENGQYNFTGFAPGNYIVREDLFDVDAIDYGPVRPALGYHQVFVGLGQEITDLDFGNAEKTATLSGFKFEDDGDGIFEDETEDPMVADIVIERVSILTGLTMEIPESPITTNGDGTWSVSVSPGTYRVSEVVPPGYTQTKPGFAFYQVGVGVNGVIDDLDFGNTPGDVDLSSSISGTKFSDDDGDGVWDIDEDPLEGVTIVIYGGPSFIFESTTTDANGEYLFDDLEPGMYYVWEQLWDFDPGYVQTLPSGFDWYYTILLGVGQDVVDKDFGNKPPAMEIIEGIKFNDLDGDGFMDEGEPPIEGFPICIYDYFNGEECVTTDEEGHYSFTRATNVYYGIYERVEDLEESGLVTVSPIYGAYTGYLQDDGSFFDYYTFASHTTLNFANAEGEGAITGWKFNDLDGDGVWDDGEVGEANVAIDIYRKTVDGSFQYITTVYTDSDGLYQADGLAPGEYELIMRLPHGTVQTFPEGNAPQFVTLGFGIVEEDVNFGNHAVPPGTVQVIKFNDLDGDGQFDAGEGLLGDVEICVGTFFTFDCQTTVAGEVLTFDNVYGDTWVSEYNHPADTVPTKSFIVRNGEVVPESIVSWAYQYFFVESEETVQVYIGNKVLTPLPDDIVLPGAADYNGDGEPEQIRGRDLVLEKDLSILLDQAGKTTDDIVSVIATVTLDDGTTRTAEMTQDGVTNVYGGTVPGPFSGNSINLLIDVDFSPAGEDFGDAVENGDIVLIDPEGTVFDRSTGLPIAGATATLFKNEGGFAIAEPEDFHPDEDNPQITLADGEFSWTVVAGQYEVRATAPGYQQGESRVVETPPPATGVDIYLTPNGGLDYDLDLSDANIETGDSVTVTATTNDVIAEEVEFAWFGPGDAIAFDTETVALTDGEATSSAFAPNEAGTWTVEVTFIGDELVDGTEDDIETIESDLVVAHAEDEEGGHDDDDVPRGHGGGGGGGGDRTVVIRSDQVTTLPESHFAEHPLDKIQISNSGLLNAAGASISKAGIGQQINIAGTFSNYQQSSQNYAFIVMIVDKDGFAVNINWQQGSLASGDTTEVSTSWTPTFEGDYTVKIFVWDGISTTPTPLSQATQNNISVT